MTESTTEQSMPTDPSPAELADGELERIAGGGVYHLNRCFVKSWSTSGDADDRPTEEVAFYFNKG